MIALWIHLILKQVSTVLERRHLPHSALAQTLLLLTCFMPIQLFAETGEDVMRAEAEQRIKEDASKIELLIKHASQLEQKGNYSAAISLVKSLLASRKANPNPDQSAIADAINWLGTLYYQNGQAEDAEPLYELSASIREKIFGLDHPSVATSLSNLGVLHADKGNYSMAEKLILRSLGIREKALGLNHQDVASSLGILASLYADQGKHVQAKSYYERSIEIREKADAEDGADLGLDLINLASLYSNMGSYRQAERLFQRGIRVRQKALGENHIAMVSALNNLALLYSRQGRLTESEPLFQRSINIIQDAIGPNSAQMSAVLGNLADLYVKQGKYNKAEGVYLRSLATSEKALGVDHLDNSYTLNGLAKLYVQKGQLDKAKVLFQRSRDIRENALGKDHPAVAVSLNNLGVLYLKQGQLGEAEKLYLLSLAITQKAFGMDHPEIATTLSNLGLLYSMLGQHENAENFYQRSLAIREKILGDGHPDVANSLSNLAELYSDQADYVRAEKYHLRSLDIIRRALGKNHYEAAVRLNNLAELYADLGKYAKAEAHHKRSLAILGKTIGLNHVLSATSLGSLAMLYLESGRHDAGLSLLGMSNGIQLDWLLREVPLLPLHQRSEQLRTMGPSWMAVFGLIETVPSARSLAVETRLARHGLLQEIEQRQEMLFTTAESEQEKIDEVWLLSGQLADVTLRPERRNELRQRRDKLRVEFYRAMPALEIKPVTPEKVANSLPTDGVLVEFQRYQPFDGRKSRGERWGTALYIALVLKPNGSTAAVPLGPAAPIEQAIQKALAATGQNQDDAADLWSQVSELVLAPLQKEIGNARQWFISSDSELHRVPFAALPALQQPMATRAETVKLRTLTTGRDLLRLQSSNNRATAPVVMANPSFERRGSAGGRSTATIKAQRSVRRSGELDSQRWTPLPASELEGQQVAALLGTRPLLGPDASTAQLQQQKAPRILHIATHGFFLADRDTAPDDPMLVVQEGSPLLKGLRGEPPELRSGLVLAGANQPDLDPNDDGYLTAAEAVSLDLDGTELVVLSACSTGLGDIRTGEGLYGLQRSLTVAGARSTLLSLWKVDDTATAEFMVRFYRRLKAGEGRADALAAVQAEFRSGTVKSPSGEDWSRPFFWAAWQLVGDWRPIQGL